MFFTTFQLHCACDLSCSGSPWKLLGIFVCHEHSLPVSLGAHEKLLSSFSQMQSFQSSFVSPDLLWVFQSWQLLVNLLYLLHGCLSDFRFLSLCFWGHLLAQRWMLWMTNILWMGLAVAVWWLLLCYSQSLLLRNPTSLALFSMVSCEWEPLEIRL